MALQGNLGGACFSPVAGRRWLRFGWLTGRTERCETAALACGLEREGALRLYERRGYEKPSYAMRKALR
jgi:hypothetical protein